MCWRSWSVFPWRKPSWALRYDFVETPRLCHHCKEDCGQVYLIILILFAASMFIVICCYLVSMESEEVGLKGHPCFTSMVIMIASNSLLDTELIPTLAHIVYMSLTSRENLVCRVFVGDVLFVQCQTPCGIILSIQSHILHIPLVLQPMYSKDNIYPTLHKCWCLLQEQLKVWQGCHQSW